MFSRGLLVILSAADLKLDYLRLLESIRAKYAQCSSYSDSGLALVPGFGRKMTKVTFQTFFCRPHQFRFDWIFESGENRAAGAMAQFHIIKVTRKRLN